MKKKSILIEALVIILGPIGGYIGYYPSITCKPTQAGFWFILALGISIGVVLTQVAQRISEKKKERVSVITPAEQNDKN
jgi:zinc transporter ZupT